MVFRFQTSLIRRSIIIQLNNIFVGVGFKSSDIRDFEFLYVRKWDSSQSGKQIWLVFNVVLPDWK